MSHTHGPWIADVHLAQRYGGRSYVPILRPGNDPVPVAAVHLEVNGYGRDEGEANARLIAAAPDMLAALQWIAEQYENQDLNHVDFRVEAKHRADSAIAKATKP